MIVEYIRYALTTHTPTQLTEAYRQASAQLEAAPECLAFELTQCVDEPNQMTLRIEWQSAEAHMGGFRKGPHFAAFLALIRPFIPEIAEMRHYALTGVGTRKPA